MTAITWEHKKWQNVHAIKGHFIEHDSYVKVVVSSKGWDFYYGLGTGFSTLSSLFQGEIVKRLIFSLLSTVQQEDPSLFQTMIDVAELTELPYSLLIHRTEKKYATEISVKALEVTNSSKVFFVMSGYVIDDIYVKKYVSQYYISGDGEIKRNNRTLPIYNDEKEKEVLLTQLQIPEAYFEQDMPYELIEEEKHFKTFIKDAQNFSHNINHLKEPSTYTYTILSSTYNGMNHSYELQVNELPDFTFHLDFYKKRLRVGSFHVIENHLLRYNFPLNHYRLFFNPIQEYLEKKSIYRIRFLM
jgi:hypothetical protein